MSKKGKFISFSGIDGVGKTSIIRMVSEFFQENDIKHCITEEPSMNGHSYHIRKLVKEIDFSDTATLCLVMAARVEIMDSLIKPKLEEGSVVLTHRWLPDSKAYQDFKLAGELHKLICDDLTPDLQIILDAPVDRCVERITSRKNPNEPPDRFDLASEEVMEHRRTMLLRQVFEINTVVVDADYPKHIVFESVMKHVKQVIAFP